MKRPSDFHAALDHLSPEEVHALIDFNESMAADALESGEYAEAKERVLRAAALKKYLRLQIEV